MWSSDYIDQMRHHVTTPELVPISINIQVRTEFAGVTTAEVAAQSVANAYANKYGKRIELNFLSASDWSIPCRSVTKQNYPDTCRFGDIMGMWSEEAKDDLTARKYEEASDHISKKCFGM
jgi:hypothetical protein